MYEELKKYIDDASYIVFFGGAGVSVESGIPDFRSSSGLYANNKSAEYMLSHECFEDETSDFYKFYFENMIYLDAQPNACHLGLTKLEESGKLKAIITQNIDGLHQKANSKNVYELHGSVLRNECICCGSKYDLNETIALKDDHHIPRCRKCNCVIKPDVVLYGESLNEKVLYDAIDHIKKADLLIVGGTSLQVYPAAGLIHYYQGDKIVLINKGATPFDHYADLVIKDAIGEVFKKL